MNNESREKKVPQKLLVYWKELRVYIVSGLQNDKFRQNPNYLGLNHERKTRNSKKLLKLPYFQTNIYHFI